jgi:hypothetical protein
MQKIYISGKISVINQGIILSGRLKNQSLNIKNIIWAPKKIVRPPD